MTNRYDIRISGFGGQGIVLSGYILGKAAAIFDGKESAFTQSYGPEARGGACGATIVLSDQKIAYPLVGNADYLVAMSEEAYSKYIVQTTPDSIVMIDSNLVKSADMSNEKILSIPATEFAMEMGNKIIANILMLGFFTGISKIVSVEAMKESIRTTVKKAFVDLNLEAFDRGYNYAAEFTSIEALISQA